MKKINAILMALALAVSSVWYFSINGVGELYKIKHPPHGKEHAIIKIITAGGGSCTAFVVSDNTAITADHCIDFDRRTVEKYLPPFLESMRPKILMLKLTIISMIKQCGWGKGPKGCNQRIKEMEKNLFEIMKEYHRLANAKPDRLKVINIYGEDTGIVATAEYTNGRLRDNAVLSGDFRKFEKLPISNNFEVKAGDVLTSCGFAGGKTPPVCTRFEAISNDKFLFSGKGYFAKGMSGGPVIDKDGFVRGIVSRISGKGTVVMDTLLGIMDYEFKRPEKPKHYERKYK